MRPTIAILALALVTVAAPASASTYACAGQSTAGVNVCLNAGSYAYGSGDCQSAGSQYFEGSYVDVTTQANGGYHNGNVGWNCYLYDYGGTSYKGSSIYANTYSTDSTTGTHWNGVQWWSFLYTDPFGSYAYCDTATYGSDLGWNSLGCPAGDPPSGLPLLP